MVRILLFHTVQGIISDQFQLVRWVAEAGERRDGVITPAVESREIRRFDRARISGRAYMGKHRTNIDRCEPARSRMDVWLHRWKFSLISQR